MSGVKVIGYVRVSRVGGRQGDSFISPALQREQIEAVARREGLTVVEVIEELDASGGDATRPGWNRAIEMVERGEVAGIAVWNLSRFSRSVKDALTALERIEGSGGKVYSATEQWDDSSSGRFTRNVLLSVAQIERDRAAEGFRAAKAKAIERGIHMRVPFGYVRDADRRLVPDPDGAPLVQGAFERKSRGEAVSAIARWLREQGAPVTTATGVRHMLGNRAYRGEAHAGDLVKEDAHPALVTEALWRRCQTKGVRSQRTGRLAGRYLLGGIATCASCGRGLRLSSGGRKGRAFYYCRGHDCSERGYAGAQELDDLVLDLAFEPLREGGLEAQWVAVPGGGEGAAEAERAAEDAREDLDSYLGDVRLRGVIGPDRFADGASDRVAILNKAEADLAEAREASSGSAEVFGRLWAVEWGHAEKCEWLARAVRAVVVSKGRAPLSSRVEVTLR